MNLRSSNLKLIIGITYLSIILIGLFFLLSVIDIRDLASYEFIKQNKDIIIKYKNDNFIFLVTVFFLFTATWVLLLGFATPILLFAGFVFGKWWGTIIVLISTTIGASLLYALVNFFLKEFVKEKLSPRFSKLKEFFNKNDVLYYTIFRFVGGGGLPYAIQNVLPVLFNMSIKNYAIATFLGSIPAMFVTVSLGSGIESVIEKNDKLRILDILQSKEIYLPIIGFFIIIIIAFLVKKIFFKEKI
jgi:uncharacterized membrane protein YdjX (TVP38/TMEM64 family)